jgi:hypothetical protein
MCKNYILNVSFAFTTMWIYLLGTPLVSTSIPIPYDRTAADQLSSLSIPFVAIKI